MTATHNRRPLSDLSQEALDYYESKLKPKLMTDHLGEVVAIHVDSGDYEVAEKGRAAVAALLTRHEQDGRIVTFRIGPPTDSDIHLVSRIVAADKR